MNSNGLPHDYEVFRYQGYIHIRPRLDLVGHELSDECPCGPTSRFHACTGHEDEWYVMHHALDGRERGARLTRGDVLG